ncbi:DUF1194 domain-containing protein [Sinorhizobium chiapasense]|uniref:DUF1194 domain-containing protein n=1 Tax=Sinorhizobium chiapasense TaxID=501572 RepID=A0ABZ2BEX2_9HYPH
MRNALAAAMSALFLCTPAASEPHACVDVALVLAVDGSGSISEEEYAFQKSAIAAAFRDNGVQSALNRAGVVALSAVFWGDGEFAVQKLDWHVVYHGHGAETFAREIEGNQRLVFGNTDIGSGIWSALDLLADPRFCAERSIVNISGDGKETVAPKQRQRASLYAARLRARKMGVTVNALTISDEEEDLASYYASEVILGADAFVMDVRNEADFAAAIRRKLIRELSPQIVARLHD